MTAVDVLEALLNAGADMAQELQALADDTVEASGDPADAQYLIGLVEAWESAFRDAEARLARDEEPE